MTTPEDREPAPEPSADQGDADGQAQTEATHGPQPDAAPAEGLGRSAAAGAAWLTAQKWVVRLSGLVTISILARLVSPHDFGVVAAASAVLPFVLLLSDLGLSTYLVQAHDPDQRTLSTGFWFSLTAAFVLGGSMLAFVPVMVGLLDLPDAAPVLRVLLISVPLVVAGAVPTALIKRRMQFRRLAFQGALGAGVAQVVAIIIAVSGGGAWALVGQAISTTLITTSAAWITARWSRPSSSRSASSARWPVSGTRSSRSRSSRASQLGRDRDGDHLARARGARLPHDRPKARPSRSGTRWQPPSPRCPWSCSPRCATSPNVCARRTARPPSSLTAP